jgi:hypothetical protein
VRAAETMTTSSTRTSQNFQFVSAFVQNAANASTGKLWQIALVNQWVSAHILSKAMLRLLKWHWTGAKQ